MRSILALAAVLTAAALPPSFAQETERYSLERTDEGFVRMDSATGRMSICQEQGDQLVCRMSADDRSAYEDRIDDLEKRVEALEARLDDGRSALPSEQEFERSLGYMQKFFQSFFDVVRDWEQDLRREPDSQPDRT